MNEAEAREILQHYLNGLRHLAYEGLVDRYLDATQAIELTIGLSGAHYQVEVQAMWDDPRRKHANLLVIVSIDDGRGWRAFSPLTDGFIRAPDGSFIGE
jgi:hypothetical protein